MARTKGAKDSTPRKKRGSSSTESSAPPAQGSVIGHNRAQQIAQMTPEQRQSLHFNHKRIYKELSATANTAISNLRNHCKVIKSDLGMLGLDQIKKSIKLETPDGEKLFKAQMASDVEVAAMNNLPIAVVTMEELFPPDRQPGEERAFKEGRIAGMEGRDRASPYGKGTPQDHRWHDGYQEGQEINLSLIKQLNQEQRAEDAKAFDQAPPPAAAETKEPETATADDF